MAELTDLEKREAVIANVMRTGRACYPVWLSMTRRCHRCGYGPCPGPIEKYESIGERT